MVEHRCNKETEIAEIHSDIKWVRKSLEGNGVKGFFKKVDDLTEYVNKQRGWYKAVNFAVGSGWLLTIIIFLMR